MSDLHGIVTPITGYENADQIATLVRKYDEDDCLDIAIRTLEAIAGVNCRRVTNARASARSTLILIDVIRGDQPITAIESD